MDVSESRLRDDIETNAEFGSIPVDDGRGRTVLTGTVAEKQAREYLVERMEEAGLDVRWDAVGNIAGRWHPDGVDEDVKPTATGSHLDSVPEGGIFDGVLGVYGALEAVRTLQDLAVPVERPVEVVCFTEEEGVRFSDGVLGSSVAVGDVRVEEALALSDPDGVTLEAALEDIGWSGTGRIDAGEWHTWVELHVEQGEVLQNAGAPVGVVTDIAGATRCTVEITGEANHAGTTSMAERVDALAAASEVILDVETETEEVVTNQSSTAVGTVGALDVYPNAVNVIPGRVVLRVDIRDIEYASMETIVERVQACLDRLEEERGVSTSFERPYDLRPTPMAERCTVAAERSVRTAGVEPIRLHSGAGHDTMKIAEVTDAGLLFARSREGLSHSPFEWTAWSDCVTATSVLARTIANLSSD